MKNEIEQIESVDTLAISEVAPPKVSRFSAFARDVATMSVGTVLAAVFSTLLVFLIPRLVSVEDFGYWRLFLLYASYTGFLHLGFADGALLRWAGQSLEALRPELRPSLKFLFWQQVTLLVSGSAITWWLLHSNARFVGMAVLTYALVYNVNALLQYSLQARRRFLPVAAVTAGPTGIFLILTFLWSLHAIPSFRILIVLYVVAATCGLCFLWTQARPQTTSDERSARKIGMQYIAMGWPIVLANTTYGLIQSSDRLVVSATLPIHQFALYSFAVSTMFVPLTAIPAVSQVFFPHLAAVREESRAKAYSLTTWLIVIAWSLLLPYYFVLATFVHRFLPKYQASLPIAGILLFGVVFLAGITILQSTFFKLCGLQRCFLLYATAAAVLSFAAVFLAAVRFRSLIAIAVAQVIAVALWWLLNEWMLRETTGQGAKEWSRILSVLGWSAASYGLALWCTPYIGWRISIYYALVACGLWFSCRKEFRLGWGLLYPTEVGFSG